MKPEDILVLEMKREAVKELLVYLTEHDTHSDRHDPNHIAWNIKTHAADESLKDPELRREYRLKDKHDERWEKELEQNRELVWNCCEDGLDFVGDTLDKKRNPFSPWTTKEGDEFDYEIWQAGRSGGWLELHTFEGGKVKPAYLKELYECLCETEADYCCRACEGHMIQVEVKGGYTGTYNVPKWVREKCHGPGLHTQSYYEELEGKLFEQDWLEKLVRFCRSLDGFDANKKLEHQLAHRRQQLEEEWETVGEESEKEEAEYKHTQE